MVCVIIFTEKDFILINYENNQKVVTVAYMEDLNMQEIEEEA